MTQTHPIIFEQLVLIAGIGVIAAIVLRRLKLPIVTILLIAGAFIGPYGFRLIDDESAIEGFAEVGVILLLFSIGLEFSISKLLRIGKYVTYGGLLQVILTIFASVIVGSFFGQSVARGIFFGFLIALSSTAIVLRALGERSEIDSPHGRFIVGILIFQDLCVVPMVLLVPILAQPGALSAFSKIGWALLKAMLVVGLTISISRWLLPKFFALVDRAQSREIFILSVMVICLGTAWLTSLAGLSLALGAFLAGMILAETDYAHRATSDILPIRDIFTSFFFISLGMLFDGRVIVENWSLALTLIVAIIIGKAIIAGLSGLVMRFSISVAIVAGFGLAQFGEFGFILAKSGNSLGLLSNDEMRLILAAGVITMIVTPLIIRYSPRLAARTDRMRRLQRILGARGIGEIAPVHKQMHDHIVVVGYGVGGQVLAEALKVEKLPFIVIEMNADLVREARHSGMPAYYGDIAGLETIEQASVRSARALALMINDPRAVERALVTIKRLAPDVPIYMRGRRLQNVPFLKKLGAKLVIVEEVEAAIAMLGKILKLTPLSPNQQIEHIQTARAKIKEAYYREL